MSPIVYLPLMIAVPMPQGLSAPQGQGVITALNRDQGDRWSFICDDYRNGATSNTKDVCIHVENGKRLCQPFSGSGCDSGMYRVNQPDDTPERVGKRAEYACHEAVRRIFNVELWPKDEFFEANGTIASDPFLNELEASIEVAPMIGQFMTGGGGIDHARSFKPESQHPSSGSGGGGMGMGIELYFAAKKVTKWLDAGGGGGGGFNNADSSAGWGSGGGCDGNATGTAQHVGGGCGGALEQSTNCQNDGNNKPAELTQYLANLKNSKSSKRLKRHLVCLGKGGGGGGVGDGADKNHYSFKFALGKRAAIEAVFQLYPDWGSKDQPGGESMWNKATEKCGGWGESTWKCRCEYMKKESNGDWAKQLKC